MKKADFTLELIKDNRTLLRLIETLATTLTLSLDIETTEWWNRQREKISLLQLAYRNGQQVKVAVIDAFAPVDFDLLKTVLEADPITKVVHNASFDVPRLVKHYAINADPVYDTMSAARFNGERKYSLAAQANTHLNLHLDKSFQKTDWSRRPLSSEQLYYAAVDAYAALLLYENQIGRGLFGIYQSKKLFDDRQVELPLGDLPEVNSVPNQTIQSNEIAAKKGLSDLQQALLGIVTELPTRFSPDALTVAVGSERSGLAGWIIERRLGTDADLDQESVKMAIAELCAEQLVQINETRRLIATSEGAKLWQKFKNG